MSYIWTLLGIVCMAVISHAAGFVTREDAAWVLWVSIAVLAAHGLVSLARNLGRLDMDTPFEELHGEFLKAYFDACNSRNPDWYHVAQAAKRWEIALTAPRRHAMLRGVKRGSA